ncbi:MAG: hypothetical protein BWY32_02153 [bacterium ADurb.Bin243]|nr:MAG: hypothetical protein BWY32_02153 [bacterium ADurb.Bin243]
MKRFSVLALTFLVFLSLSSTAFALNYDEDLTVYESRMANQMIIKYWQALDIIYTIEGKAERCDNLVCQYKQLVKQIDEISSELSAHIITKMNKKNLGPLRKFSEFYKCKQSWERQPLYSVCEPVIKKVKEDMLASGKVSIFSSAEDFAAEYFPGYGYAEPGFEYRRGKEIESQFLHAYWQEEEKIIETAQHFEGTIDFKLAAELRVNPNLTGYREHGEPFKIDIGGHIVVVIKVSFDTHTRLTTRSKKKYAATKVWFELLKRKKSVMSSSQWEVCGKTFEMHDFYTNEEVIADVKF